MIDYLIVAAGVGVLVLINVQHFWKRYKQRRLDRITQHTYDSPPQPGSPGSIVRITRKDQDGNFVHDTKTL
jgi:hypothetical protein